MLLSGYSLLYQGEESETYLVYSCVISEKVISVHVIHSLSILHVNQQERQLYMTTLHTY